MKKEKIIEKFDEMFPKDGGWITCAIDECDIAN